MFSQIFIRRPRLAIVVSLVITIAGLISLYTIPVAQLPDVVPPSVDTSMIAPSGMLMRCQPASRASACAVAFCALMSVALRRQCRRELADSSLV